MVIRTCGLVKFPRYSQGVSVQCSVSLLYLQLAVSMCVLVSAPDPPCTHKKKKRKESARRGSGAVDTEGLYGM